MLLFNIKILSILKNARLEQEPFPIHSLSPYCRSAAGCASHKQHLSDSHSRQHQDVQAVQFLHRVCRLQSCSNSRHTLPNARATIRGWCCVALCCPGSLFHHLEGLLVGPWFSQPWPLQIASHFLEECLLFGLSDVSSGWTQAASLAEHWFLFYIAEVIPHSSL